MEFYKRNILFGCEYVDNSYGEVHLIRTLPRQVVGDLREFAIKINSYTFSGRFLTPLSMSIDKNKVSILYRYFGEKLLVSRDNIISELSDELRDRLISSLIRIAKFVILGNIPPFPVYTLYDIFTYAGEFFFIPPCSFSNNLWKDLLSDSSIRNDYIFADEEFLRSGTFEKRSSLNVIAQMISFFDKKGTYTEVVDKLKTGTVRPTDLEKDPIDEEIIRKILYEVENTKDNFKIIRIETEESYRLFKDYIARIDEYFNNKGEPLIYVGNDLVNVIKQLLWKFRSKLTTIEIDNFVKCFYSPCKFDFIAEEILKVLKSVGNVRLVIKDIDESHYLLRKFLGIVENSNIKSVILTFKASHPHNCFKIKTFAEKYFNKSELSSISDSESALLSVLGNRFSREDINIFSKVTGVNGEKLLEELLAKGIIKSDDGEYIFRIDLKDLEKLLDMHTVQILHTKLAEEYKKQANLYNLGLFKAAKHYFHSGKELSAIVMYFRFIRESLDNYVFSPATISSVFEEVYEILKKIGRLDSYAFHKLRLEFLYRTGMNVLKDIELPSSDKKIYFYLKVLALFVNEEYLKCIDYANNLLNNADFSKFKYLRISLIRERANLAYNDKVSENAIKNLQIILNMPTYNKSWASLKASWLWLFGTFYAYSDVKKASQYIQQAFNIANEYDLRYLLINIYNTMGLIHDGAMLSVAYFKETIRISNEIGYVQRSLSPRLNLSRELLYFGRFDELFSELSRVVSNRSYLSSSDLAYFYRLYGMVHSYRKKYEEGLEYFKKAFQIEESNNLPHSSLRGLILHELLCGNFERAIEIIQNYYDDQSIHIRGFEYFVKLITANSDEEFLKHWLDYKNSDYLLLREEILYVFANRLYKVDPYGFLNELEKWDDFYSSQMTKLSLLYVLLGKATYYKLSGDLLREELTRFRIGRIVKELNIHKEFPEFSDYNYGTDDIALMNALEVLKGIDSKISVPEFLRLFSNVIIDIFEPKNFFLSVDDIRTNISFKIGLQNAHNSGSYIEFSPFQVSIKDQIDSECSYELSFTTDTFIEDNYEKTQIVETVNLLEELFSGQLRGVIFRERANRDPLTRLYNRWKFNEVFKEYLEKSVIKGTEISFFITDIDNFKKVNDTYGHLKGDEVLKGVAKILEEITSDRGFVARYGGEEFVGVFELDKNSCVSICEEIRNRISSESDSLFGFQVTLSFGVASSKERTNDTELMGLADQRLYIAKESGKNRVCWW